MSANPLSPDRSPEPMKDTTRLDAITSGGYTLRSYGSVAEFTVTKEAMPEGPRFKDARQAIDAALASPPPPEPMKPVRIQQITYGGMPMGSFEVPPDQTPERPTRQSIEEMLDRFQTAVLVKMDSDNYEEGSCDWITANHGLDAARSALLAAFEQARREAFDEGFEEGQGV